MLHTVFCQHAEVSQPYCHPETKTWPQRTGSVYCQRDTVLMWPTWSLRHRSGLDSSPSGMLSGWQSSNEAPNPNRTFWSLHELIEVGNVIQFRNGRHLDTLGRTQSRPMYKIIRCHQLWMFTMDDPHLGKWILLVLERRLSWYCDNPCTTLNIFHYLFETWSIFLSE